MPLLHIDSSDEDDVIQQPDTAEQTTSQINYIDSLVKDFNVVSSIIPANFELYLGLILHKLIESISSSFTSIDYKNFKDELFKWSKEKYDTTLTHIKQSVSVSLEKSGQSISADITDEQYISLFNYLFNNQVLIPAIFQDIDTKLLRNILAENLSKLKFLDIDPLLITVNKLSSFIILPRIMNRINKNNLKLTLLKQLDEHTTSIVLEINDSKFTINNNAKKSGNICHKVQDVDNYTNIFNRIVNSKIDLGDLSKYMFSIIGNSQHDLKLSHQNIDFINKIFALMFIVEPQRNEATLLTSPMFLELITISPEYLNTTNFPMATEGAVVASRGIYNRYKTFYSKKSRFDYDTSNNQKKGEALLAHEGALCLTWLKAINLSDQTKFDKELDELAQYSKNFSAFICFLRQLKIINDLKVDNLNIRQIQQLLKIQIDVESVNLLKSNLEMLGINLIEPNNETINLAYSVLKHKISTKCKTRSYHDNSINLTKINTIFGYIQEHQDQLVKIYEEVLDIFSSSLKQILTKIIHVLTYRFQEWYNVDIAHSIIPPVKSNSNTVVNDEHNLVSKYARTGDYECTTQSSFDTSLIGSTDGSEL